MLIKHQVRHPSSGLAMAVQPEANKANACSGLSGAKREAL